MIAQHGYDIEQNPKFPDGKLPDFRIEGRIFDNFSPSQNKNVRNIWGVIQDKVDDGQARRAVLNLDDSSVTIDALKDQFRNWRIEGLEEVIAVRGRKIYQIFPEMDS